MAVKTCKKDCSPENKDKFLSEAGMSGGAASFWGSSAAPRVLWGTGVPVGWLGWESGHGLSPSPKSGDALPLKHGSQQVEEGALCAPP